MESCAAPCDNRAPTWPLLLRPLCSLVADLYHPGDHHERRDGEGVAPQVGQGCECWVGGGWWAVGSVWARKDGAGMPIHLSGSAASLVPDFPG